jgi:DNA-binding FrmR family transcriptional regulator
MYTPRGYVKRMMNPSDSVTSSVDTTSPEATASDPVLIQLKRIKGQLDGVIEMYQDERACVDIVRQVIAVRSSLGRVARDILTGEASRCTHERRITDLDDILKELFRY